jgi:hypothetical protein
MSTALALHIRRRAPTTIGAKGEERNGATTRSGESNITTKRTSEKIMAKLQQIVDKGVWHGVHLTD